MKAQLIHHSSNFSLAMGKLRPKYHPKVQKINQTYSTSANPEAISQGTNPALTYYRKYPFS